MSRTGKHYYRLSFLRVLESRYRRSLLRPKNMIQAITSGYAIHLLRMNCMDWTVTTRDWPRHGMTKAGIAHYEVNAFAFWSRGRGVGRTALEATRRALRNLEIRDRKIPRVPFSDALTNTVEDA